MNSTPRMLNRVLILLAGLVLLAAGVLAVLLAAVPSVTAWWRGWAPQAALAAGRAFEGARVPGTSLSWLWIAAMVLTIVLALLMVWWVAQQGRGRRDLVAATAPDGGAGPGGSLADGEVPGRVSIAASAVEQALRSGLAERKDVLGTSVAAVDFEGSTALRVKVVARHGADPGDLAAEAERLVASLDSVMGTRTPVLVHIASGARARLSRAERVH
ncbi:hypothetical protein [Sinomonas mesophila]|uniref:hypothetical protein n=1 Tax=Sinomonas mesophila TaxID=1531955 RepID=UPI000986AE27|nr:hypothetical protein [Sinomonas mesophila]